MTLLSAALSLALAAHAAPPPAAKPVAPRSAQTEDAAPAIGKPAPDFSLPAQDGKSVKLSAQKGNWVVLEWFNKDCPFVRKHYDSKHMQGLQARWAKKGVRWFSIVSSKPGKQGHVSAAEAAAQMKKDGMASRAILLDPSGDVGRLYGAKTTPHLFVIDPKGVLVYMGAIDDKASTDPADIPGSRDHVSAALEEGLAGKPVSVPSTKPYGCSVKY